MELCSVYVSVPVACFRVPQAREYFETFPCPPPSTVYGMLLSAVGEVDRGVHEGADIAMAVLADPEYSIVLRTMWRVKSRQDGLGLGTNRRPDFQEILTNSEFAVWIRKGAQEKAEPSLASRVREALDRPSSVRRFGGLSLGESSHLVDQLSFLNGNHTRGQLLIADQDGHLTLPVWPDHVGARTRWRQYTLKDSDLTEDFPEDAWTSIRRPERGRPHSHPEN